MAVADILNLPHHRMDNTKADIIPLVGMRSSAIERNPAFATRLGRKTRELPGDGPRGGLTPYGGFWQHAVQSPKGVVFQVKAKLLLSLMSVVIALVLFEVLLRNVPPGTPVSRRHDRPAVIFAPGEQRMNAWAKPHPDPLRVAVVGDSVTAGSGCQFYDTYGMRLEAMLNYNDGQRPAMVRIWAKGGLSPSTELRFRADIRAWNPDLLILGICLNDAEDSGKMGELNRWRLKALPPPPPEWLAGPLRVTRVGTLLYQKAASLKARRGYLKYYRRLYDTRYSGWQHLASAIHAWRDFCRENEIVFLPVVFPLFSDIDRYPFDGVHEQIGGLMRSADIPYLDLLDTFRGLSPLRLQAIPSVDSHPNEIAHRLSAETIFYYLLANGLVDSSYMPRHADASPERMWRMLDRFIHSVVSVDAAETEALKESEQGVDEGGGGGAGEDQR